MLGNGDLSYGNLIIILVIEIIVVFLGALPVGEQDGNGNSILQEMGGPSKLII